MPTPHPTEVPPSHVAETSDESSTTVETDHGQCGTGESGIAAEVAADLSRLADLPVEQHPEVYDDIHRRLGDTLSGIDHV